MTGRKIMPAKAAPPASPASLGVRLAPDQDPAAKVQTVCLDRATQRAAGGSEVGAFNLDLIGRVTACARINADPGDPDAARQAAQTSEAVIAALSAFRPVDEIEAMLGAQAVMLHHVALDAGRRAMRSGQPEVASRLRRDAANSARAMVEACEALDRRRGKGGQQRIVVERVVVQDGGQAVVAGSVVGRGALPPAGPAPRATGRDVEPADAGGGEGARG